ncbi:zf-TFIIB domain-containing protein [Pseudoxanthomonas kalamensis]|uniref:TFIIB-type zinc ribbon-containing protein n=1 Tax=Pseudoxanthomonas kalamensis TaxID=289483 RepID=UPI001B86ACA9|nr:zf-TFIIB domain-containing protein [Pseudoxanthomonas kalamensis]
MQCPKCRGAMEEVRHLAAHADRCTRCHGLWFDMREHVLLAEYAEEVDIGDEDTGERHNRIDRIHCPVCERANAT